MPMTLRARKKPPTISFSKVTEKSLKEIKDKKSVKPVKSKEEEDKIPNEYTYKYTKTKYSKKSISSSNNSISESSAISDESYSEEKMERSKSQRKKKISKAKNIVSKKGKKKSKKNNLNTKCGYSNEEMVKYNDLQDKYQLMNVKQLKEILELNLQTKSGNKGELAAKIADGVLKGAIPKCPKCNGGNLKYDYKIDTYYCKGYMDDQNWHYCNYNGTSQNVVRMPWVLPPSQSQK